jgi:hypothetical protein
MQELLWHADKLAYSDVHSQVRSRTGSSASIMITKIYAQLHRKAIMVAPRIDWSASIEKDIQCLS